MPAELKKVKDEEARVEAEEAAKRALEEYEVRSQISTDCALFFFYEDNDRFKLEILNVEFYTLILGDASTNAS